MKRKDCGIMNRDPYLVIEWSDRESEAIGWFAIYNFADEQSAGGLRMTDNVTRDEVERLSQVMSYKYVAAENMCGGAKAGIKYDYHKPDALDVIRRFLQAVKPYLMAGAFLGGDLGTDPAEVTRIEHELGIYDRMGASVRANPEKAREADRITQEMKNKLFIDDLNMDRTVSGFGTAVAADEAWKFINGGKGATVSIQGFGKVGGSCALCLQRWGYKIVAISDINGMYYNENGLDIRDMLDATDKLGEVHVDKMKTPCEVRDRDDWLGLDVDILIPAAIEDVINSESVHTVKASLIVEGANIPTTEDADKVLEDKGIHVVPDFIANQGGVTVYGCISRKGCTTPETVMDGIEKIIRKGVQRTFQYAKDNNVSEREAAWIIFKPDASWNEPPVM